MTTNVLITSASRKVGLVKAFQNALRLEGGGVVIAVDIDPFSAALYHSDIAFIVPKSTDERFIPTILKLCKKEKIDVVIPTRDEDLLLFAENKDSFNTIGTKVMVSDPNAIRICNDKHTFIQFCQKNNFLVPKTFSTYEIKQGYFTFPLFVRDRFGKGSKKAFKVKDKTELDFILHQVEQPVIQEYYEGTEYTIDLFADFNGTIISVVPRERISVFGGESFVGRTYKNNFLINEGSKLAEKLHLIGHNTIQCFFDNDETVFIEVNPRYGGGANLSFAAGANTPRYLIQLVKNKKVKSRIGQFQDSFIMLRYTEDFFVEEKKIAKQVKRFD
jgi:carbamoyl-phosphate synthase large subunit